MQEAEIGREFIWALTNCNSRDIDLGCPQKSVLRKRKTQGLIKTKSPEPTKNFLVRTLIYFKATQNIFVLKES